jgi:hypothetical protein
LQLELVYGSLLGATRDHLVKVAVFCFQGGELCPQGFDIEVHGRCHQFSLSL